MIKHLLIFILVGLLATSCKKDKISPEDSTMAKLSLMGINPGDTLQNIVSAKIKGLSKNSYKKIEVYASDSLIATSSSSELELNWNTLTTDDGKYTLKAIAYELDNNKVELQFPVFVQNTLITLEVRQTFGMRVEQLYNMVAFDDEGNLIASAVYDKNIDQTVILKPKTPYYKKTLNLLTWPDKQPFSIFINPPSYYAHINLKRGTIWKGEPVFHFWETRLFKPDVKTGLTFNTKNISPDINQLMVSSDHYGSFFWRDFPITTFDLSGLSAISSFSTGSKIFAQVVKSKSAFYNFFPVDPATNTCTLDFAECTKPSSIKVIAVPAEYSSMTIRGIPGKGSDNGYEFGFQISYANPAKYFMPDVVMDRYLTSISYAKENWSFTQNFVGAIPTSVSPFNVNAEILEPRISNFNAKLSGDYNVYVARFVGPQNKQVTLVSFPNSTSFKFPDLSKVLNKPELDFSAFTLKSIRLIKKAGLTHDLLDMEDGFGGPYPAITAYKSF